MKERSSPAKITRPSSNGGLPRPRLFRKLDVEIEKAAVWISGPGGSGKTTLAAGYLDARKLPCLWYQVDERDVDIATFFFYMSIAARNAFPRHRGPLPLLEAEYAGDVPAFARRWFEMLYFRMPCPYVIVIDNYQAVTSGSLIHEVINAGISAAGDGIHFILISRNDPGPEFARLRANRVMGFVGWQDLRFTIEETREVLRACMQTEIPQKSLIALHEKTEGWAAGIVLMTERAKESGSDQGISMAALEKVPHEGMFDYYASEVFNKIGSEMQAFLLKTAFLPEMNAALADRLTGWSRAESILSSLNRKNYFTERSAGADPVYRFHPLFRDFLLAAAKRHFKKEEFAQIQLTAAGMLEESGRAEDAFLLRRDSGDRKGLARMIMEHADDLLAQGRGKTLEEWLGAVPEEYMNSDPRLFYWLGECRLPFDTCNSRDCFEKAFMGGVAKHDPELALCAWAGAIETIFLERGDFSKMDPWISWMDRKRVEGLRGVSSELEIRVVTAMMNAVLARVPFSKRADEWTNKAQALLGSDISIDARITLATPLHLYYVYTGDFMNAALIVKRFEHEVACSELKPFSKIRWALIEAVNFHMVEPAPERCMEAVERGMSLSREAGIHVLDIPPCCRPALTERLQPEI